MGVVQSSMGGTTEAAAVGAAFIAGTATAYTVYKQRFASTSITDKSTNVSEEKSNSTTSSGKKKNNYNNKSKKGGDGEDAELDVLLARAKAERAAIAESGGASSSKGVIPGSFELDGVDVSIEVEGKEKKARRKGKKKGASSGVNAATTVGEASGAASSIGGGEDVSKKTAPASTNKLIDSPVQPNVPAPTTESTAGSLKKQKKRKAAKAADNATTVPSGSTAAPASSSNVNKPTGTAPSLQSSQALGMSVTMSDAPDDASWTRVSTRKKNINDNQTQQPVRRETSQTDPELFTSDTNVTTSGVTDQDDENENTEEDEGEGEGSVREPEHRRTFAERMLPKPRKTGVEDMEDEPLQPTLSRVMRITPKPGEKPAKGFSWADYEEYAGAEEGTSADGDEDDGWEEVKSKKKKLDRSTSGLTSSVDSLSLSQPQTQTQTAASGKQTKRQRQNAKRKESKQLEKQAQDQEQRDRLAKHQRELERERINEQYANSGGGGSGKKNVSGGMKASVEGGKLVWD